MHPETLELIVQRIPGRRILVVGDVMLDEYLVGTVRRVSPEAPVPVVELQQRNCIPGGAANAAVNARGLRAEVALVGIIGTDQAAARLGEALHSRGLGTEGLLSDATRPTTTKTRIIAHAQQVVRVDHEDVSPLSAFLESQLFRLINERLAWCEVCVLSDYSKGLVSVSLAQHLLSQATRLGKPVIADPKGTDGSRYRGAALVKPNSMEASRFLGYDLAFEANALTVGSRLLDVFGSAAVLLTRGAAGMTLFQHGNEPYHVPAQAREVFDVTGAGDTVAATLAVALAAGATLEQAAQLASRAAAVVVGRLGTAAVQFEDLCSDL